MHRYSTACWAWLTVSRPLIDWRVIELRKNLTLCLRAWHRLIISLSVRVSFMQYGHLSFMRKDTFYIYTALHSELLGKVQFFRRKSAKPWLLNCQDQVDAYCVKHFFDVTLISGYQKKMLLVAADLLLFEPLLLSTSI